jgi:hypothetical protein
MSKLRVKFGTLHPRYCICNIVDRVSTSLYDYRLPWRDFHVPKRWSEPGGHERRGLRRHLWCDSWFSVEEGRIQVVRSSGLHVDDSRLDQSAGSYRGRLCRRGWRQPRFHSGWREIHNGGLPRRGRNRPQ